MKGKSIIFIIISIICIASCLLVACNYPNYENGNKYDPTIFLSGDVKEIVEYSPIGAGGLKWSRLELTEILTNAEVLGDIKSVTILTHGPQTIMINASSLSEYYLILESNGATTLHSRLGLHQSIAKLPLKGLSEIIISTNQGKGIKLVYDEKTVTVDYSRFLRAYLTEKIDDAMEDNKFELTTYNIQIVSVKALLSNNESAILRLKNDTYVEIDKNSTNKIHWAKGGLYLTEDYNSPIVEIDYRQKTPLA